MKGVWAQAHPPGLRSFFMAAEQEKLAAGKIRQQKRLELK
jgi:hypothetical protein